MGEVLHKYIYIYVCMNIMCSYDPKKNNLLLYDFIYINHDSNLEIDETKVNIQKENCHYY